MGAADDNRDESQASSSEEVSADDMTGGNKNGMASAPASMDEANLRSDFIDALEAVRESHDQVVPVTERGNDVLLWFGEWDLADAPMNYDQDSCEVFMLVDSGFPSGDPHWILTTPAVTVNGNDPGNFPKRSVFTKEDNSHGDKAEFLCDITGRDSALAFSWRWSNTDMSPTEPEHLTRAVTMIESCLRGD